MPLPKPQINWLARFVVLLICGATIGLFVPIVWLLSVLHAPDLLVYPVLAFWVVMVIVSTLWMISVWAPVLGKKIADRVLKTPWSF